VTATNSVLTELRAKNAGAAALTKAIDRCVASENLARMAREELTAHGESPYYFALLDAYRDEIKGAAL